MDDEKCLVLVKGEDKTAQIQRLDAQGPFVHVTYDNSPKPYRYANKDIVVLRNPVVTQIAEHSVAYLDGIPFPDAIRVMDFHGTVRVQFRRRASRIYPSASVRIEQMGLTKSDAREILQHWAQIARHTSIRDEGAGTRTFLGSQFDKLTLINPRSVLRRYLERDRVDVANLSDSKTIFPFRFNLSQKEALDNALRSKISIIEGPPGTGKTQTILNIVSNLVMQHRTVAVVSSNNAAVQNVHDKLASQGYGFLVAALGNRENKERFFDNLPQVDVATWKSHMETDALWARVSELSHRVNRLMVAERRRAQLQRQLSAYQLEQQHFEAYLPNQLTDEFRPLRFFRWTPGKILSFLAENHVVAARGKDPGMLYKLKLVLRYGFIHFGWMKYRDTGVVLSLQKKYYTLKIEQLKRRIEGLKRELDRESYSNLLDEYQQVSEQLFRNTLHERYAGHGDSSAPFTLKTYKNNYEAFIKQYPVTLSTTYSLRNCIPEHFLFDYVIIDEASQVDLLTAALVLSCCEHVIVVGDTKQLPRIVDEDIKEKVAIPDTIAGEPYDYFRHSLLSSMIHLYGDDVPRVMLREHYRCHPRIIEFCNQKYYDGQLIPFTTEQEGDNVLTIYRTAPGHHMRDVTHGQKGKFNQRELDVIEREILDDVGASTHSDADIGIVTPYRKQVQKASEQLREGIEIDTVHKYQGREKPVMILSTVLDDSNAGKAGLRFVDDPCMINVAVSRAQRRFILVTDYALFRNSNTEIGDLIRYMEYNTLDENIVESQIVSVFDLLYKDYSAKLRGFQKRQSLRRAGKAKSTYQSENSIWALLDGILRDETYRGLAYRDQIFVMNLIHDLSRLSPDQRKYVEQGASVDFVIYRTLDKSPVLAIEVDGFAFHENNPRQLVRDEMKNHILAEHGLPLMRLPTTGSDEEHKIRVKLDELLGR